MVSAEIRQVKLEELLLYLLQLDAEKLQSLQNIPADLTDLHLQKVAESHVGKSITVEELAFLCNMSTSTFKRHFSRVYGTSPQQWLLKEKLNMAAALLQSAEETPASVYIKLGYKNHSSFSQAFLQQFGLTPSEYRVQHLNV